MNQINMNTSNDLLRMLLVQAIKEDRVTKVRDRKGNVLYYLKDAEKI